MKRRSFLAGAATAALAHPSLAQPALAQPALGGKTKTLSYVPQANLTSLDHCSRHPQLRRDGV
jgi:hypothetical protein